MQKIRNQLPKLSFSIKALFALFVLTAIIILLYLPGTSGSFYYDDIRPLSALSKVTDLDTALIYVFSETSGVLGRSITMLSFLLHINDWPTGSHSGSSDNFFLFNITLHAINGLLVFGLSFYIAKLLQHTQNKCFYFAFGIAAFWLVLPIHVSTSLIAVQRMAGLSAFFVFAGLLTYVYGLSKQSTSQNNDTSGLYWQLTGLFLFTLLAMFSKENGVLLPIFALVLETTLFAKLTSIQYRRRLRVTGCSIGLILILGYLLVFVINHNNILPGRDFSITERLLTQPQVLIDYLTLAFIPDSSAFNPFHDNYQHVTSAFSSLKAFLSILIVISLFCFAIIFRKRFPVYAFAILWFFTAHLLESSVLNLELYFEHRNYVALFGPCLALIFTVGTVTQQYKKYAYVFIISYWLMLAFSLAMTTQLWGDPDLSAQVWFNKQKGSVRATERLAWLKLSQREIFPARMALEKQVLACPNCITSRIQALYMSCIMQDSEHIIRHKTATFELSEKITNLFRAPAALPMLTHAVKNNACSNELTINDLKALNHSILAHKELKLGEQRTILTNLYELSLAENNNAQAIDYLERAWQINYSQRLGKLLAALLLADKQYTQALKFANEKMCLHLPKHPYLAEKARQSCQQWIEKITQEQDNAAK